MARNDVSKAHSIGLRRTHVFVMFADIKGFSSLKLAQQGLYLDVVLEPIAEILCKSEHDKIQANTWGDGLFAYFRTVTGALRCALSLRDFFRETDWELLGLPSLAIRISLHSGEVFEGRNPITGKSELIGTEVNRAARIEPIVKPNHVYVTKAFEQTFENMCLGKETRFAKFASLGNIALPKDWGVEELYVAGRVNELVDAESVISKSADKGGSYFSKTSMFGQRLEVSQSAKLLIAQHCANGRFWQNNDIVFLESGTLSIYLLHELYRVDPKCRPEHIVTNNVAAAILTLMNDTDASDDAVVFPEDKPTNCTLIGGVLFQDYAATIPDELVKPGPIVGVLRNYLSSFCVTHVIMMVSKLDIEKGPCAVGQENRRFKRELLRFVREQSGVRLSVLLEADKLVSRRGWPCEDVDELSTPSHWDELLRSRRINIVTCESSELTVEQKGLVRREVRTLRSKGAQVTLLDVDGKVVSDAC